MKIRIYDIEETPKDNQEPNKGLHHDIHLLTDLLTRIIQKQIDPDTFEIINQISNEAHQYSINPEECLKKVQNIISSLSNDKLPIITRAFAHFLKLIDLAEVYHRIRRRRWHQRHGHPPQPGSLEAVLPDLITKGVSPTELHKAVSSLKIELVLTAHPTEVTRRTLMGKYRDIVNDLKKLDNSDLTPAERKNVLRKLQGKIESTWYTEEIRWKRPTPIDEAKWGFAVIEESLWKAIPEFMRNLDKTLLELTGIRLPLDAVPIRFASWMGGDRDGNPNITANITREVCLLARWMAADLYWRDVKVLRDSLSMNECNHELRALVGETREPYRAILRTVKDRLVRTKCLIEADLGKDVDQSSQHFPYLETRELLEPLMICYRSLNSIGAEAIAEDHLMDLIRRVTCFGLTLLPLDIRQDASRHTELMDAITQEMKLGSYESWSEEKRQEFLINIIASDKKWIPDNLRLIPDFQEYLDTFKVILEQPKNALGSYVISMASNPSDVLVVLALQKGIGVLNPLPIVPLFESINDLKNAKNSIDTLLSIPEYKKYCHGTQEIMIGYSDSSKEAGFLAASWAQYQAQESLIELEKKHHIHIVFFHGRGGTIGRGGGPTHLAIRAQPPGSVKGRLRVTQQGEIIRFRFGMPKIAERSLSIYTTATLEATLLPLDPPKEEWCSCMTMLAEASLKEYNQKINQNPDFMNYFNAVTPIKELDKFTISSRPTRRKNIGGLKALRAIPWFFAWAQNRLLLPTWCGIGEALESYLKENSFDTIKSMFENWYYFISLMNRLEMVLTTTDIHISEAYEKKLAPEELWSLGDEFRNSFHITHKILLKLLEQKELLTKDSILRRSMLVRNSELLVLHLLQIEMLSRTRKAEGQFDFKDKETLERALLISISGIAAGLHNTG